MALLIWLPLNGDLHNLGLNRVIPTNNGAIINNAGKIGKCYSFGTVASDITLPATSMTNFTTEASVSFWIKILSWNTSYATFFLAGPASTAWTAYRFGILRNNANSNLCFTISNNSSSSGANYKTSNLELNTWYHLSFCYKIGHCLIYINGTLYKDYTTTIVPDFTGITTIKIGRCTNNSSYQTNCLLNDFRIYDHCLSDKEVDEISKGLVLHYLLNNGNPNLLSEYVTPGQGAPGVTSTGGRTNYYGKYGIIIPATENADTYFRLFLKQQLVLGTTYTISCYVSGLLPGSYYNFPLFALGNTSMGILQLNHNGLCSLTFTMNSSSLSAVTTPEGDTVYVCFMDDSGRTLTSGQGTIIVNGFKLEQGNNVTSFLSMDNDIIYDSSGYNNNGTIVGEITTNNSSPKYNNNIKQTNGQYIRVNNQPTVCMPKDAITVNLWQYATSWSNPISCTEGGGWNFENSNGIRFPVYISGVGYKVAQSSITTALTLNAWHMLTGTMDKDNIKIYYDGEEVGTVTNGSTNGIGYANNYIFIGAEAQGNNIVPAGSGYTGGISDVRIYATALTQAQIKELYKTSKIVDGAIIKARDLEVSA